MRKRRSNAKIAAAFVLPGLIFMLLMVAYPLVYNFLLSFKNLSVMNLNGGQVDYVGFENYRYLWQDGILKEVLKNTLFFTVFSILFQFSFGLLFALFFKQDFHAAAPTRGILLVIWAIPATVSALLFKFMYQTEGGLFNEILLNLHLIKESLQWLTSGKLALGSAVLANIWVGMPFNMILLTAGLNSISPEVYESAIIDGASKFESFVYITLPLLRPTMLSVLILGVIYTFKNFDLVYVMTGGGPIHATELLSAYAYKLSFKEFQFSRGAAAAMVLFVCLAIVAMVYLYLSNKDENS